MDYKELAERLKKETYWLGGSHPYSHDVHPVICDEAAAAITELLVENQALRNAANGFKAQAEAAEADRDRLREALKPNCLLCDSMHENGNCTEVGGFCTAVPAAHCPLIPKLRDRAEAAEKKLAEAEALAEKAERERDIAVDLCGKLIALCSPPKEWKPKLFRRHINRPGDYMGCGYDFLDSFNRILTTLLKQQIMKFILLSGKRQKRKS